MNLWEKKKLVLICFLVILGVGIAFFKTGFLVGGEEISSIKQERLPQSLPTPTLVSVYISGAVKKPGLYDVPAGMRSIEAIKLAGGITAEAAIHKVNLARKCKDGMQIHVPLLVLPKVKQQESKTNTELVLPKVKQQESKTNTENYIQEVKAQSLAGKTPSLNRSRLNLHTATVQELAKLPGVGPALAQAIIAYRINKGFSCLEDLLKVPGIGPAKFAKLKDKLEV